MFIGQSVYVVLLIAFVNSYLSPSNYQCVRVYRVHGHQDFEGFITSQLNKDASSVDVKKGQILLEPAQCFQVLLLHQIVGSGC